MPVDRSRFPDWPALMDEAMGRDYFGGIGAELFHAVLALQKVRALELPGRRTLWARTDLDRAIDSLARSGVTIPPTQPVDVASLALEAAARRASGKGR